MMSFSVRACSKSRGAYKIAGLCKDDSSCDPRALHNDVLVITDERAR